MQLGGLAMKRIWQEKRKAAGKSIHEPGPNIVMGANAQVALEKFARYFEVGCRLVPISEESHYRLDAKRAMDYVDVRVCRTFGVGVNSIVLDGLYIHLSSSLSLRIGLRQMYWSQFLSLSKVEVVRIAPNGSARYLPLCHHHPRWRSRCTRS
jgi:hypothetical protein